MLKRLIFYLLAVFILVGCGTGAQPGIIETSKLAVERPGISAHSIKPPPPVETKEQTGSESTSQEIADTAKLEQESLYFDDEFLALIHEGKIKGVEFGIGKSIETIREAHGTPEWEDYWNGSIMMDYGSFAYGYIEDADRIHVVAYQMDRELSIDEAKKVIGKPLYEGVSEKDGMYFLTYLLKNGDELWIENFDEDKDSGIETIWLVRKDDNQ